MTYRPSLPLIPQLRRHFANTTNSTTQNQKPTQNPVAEARNQAMRERFLRVDHAGEVGADRIYAGQMAILGRSSVGGLIQHMWDQEKEHRKKFDELLPKYRTRPTAMLPIWNVAGFLLGAGTALMGPKMAMACTAAVETVITDHYNSQIRKLMEDPDANSELLTVIKQFRDDEMNHHDVAIANEAEQAPFYKAASQIIKLGCHGAIWISERV